MTNLDEIKARRGKITQGKWEIPPDEDEFLDGSVNCGDKNIALCNYFESTFENMSVTLEDQKNNADFIANAPTDIDWLVAEVERLKAEKAQAEAERNALAAELEENWPFLGGVMYAAAEMVSNGMDMTVPLEILMASGHWEEFEAHCNRYDVERFRQAVGEKWVNRLRRKPFSQQRAEKKLQENPHD